VRGRRYRRSAGGYETAKVAMSRDESSAALDEGAIYRAPMRARDRDVAAGVGALHGVAHGLVGIGDVGERAGRMVRRFADLPEGTFVWTRVPDGSYRLGRIAGPWRYDDSPSAGAVGIHHVRSARWVDRPFSEDDVPTAVAETFARGGGNLQRIHSVAAEAGTAQLWSTFSS
jgi:hypothetical protein